MSYPAIQSSQQIIRRTKGQCFPDFAHQQVRTMTGDPYTSCAECPAPCERGLFANGRMGAQLNLDASMTDNQVVLSWSCPSCGRTTTETADFLSAFRQAVEIESDPLCAKCRGNNAIAPTQVSK